MSVFGKRVFVRVKIHRIVAGAAVCVLSVYVCVRWGWGGGGRSPRESGRSAGSANTCQGSSFNLIPCNSALILPV